LLPYIREARSPEGAMSSRQIGADAETIRDNPSRFKLYLYAVLYVSFGAGAEHL